MKKKVVNIIICCLFVITLFSFSIKVEAKKNTGRKLQDSWYVTYMDSKGVSITKKYLKVKKMTITYERSNYIVAKGKFKIKLANKYVFIGNDSSIISKKKAKKILKKSPEKLYSFYVKNHKITKICIND